MRLGPITFTALLLSFAQGAWAAALTLHCQGSGSVTSIERSSSFNLDSHKDDNTTLTNKTTKRSFSGMAEVEITGQSGRIHLPQDMIPDLNNTQDGWLNFESLEISPSKIQGSAKMNFLNHPEVTLDRNTGSIEVKATGSNFSGDCQSVDTSKGPKF